MDNDFKKVKCKLIGTDGNIFALVATACRALRKAGFYKQAEELNRRITIDEEADNYYVALTIIYEYIEEDETI